MNGRTTGQITRIYPEALKGDLLFYSLDSQTILTLMQVTSSPWKRDEKESYAHDGSPSSPSSTACYSQVLPSDVSPFDLNDPSASAEASESSHATYVPLAIPCHYYYAM